MRLGWGAITVGILPRRPPCLGGRVPGRRYHRDRAPVAQWTERGRPKACVGGSSPSGGATAQRRAVTPNSARCRFDRCSRKLAEERLRLSDPAELRLDDVKAGFMVGSRLASANSFRGAVGQDDAPIVAVGRVPQG